MEDLPDALLGEIIKRLTSTSDLNSFSLVSKNLYTVEAELRDAIRVGCGICPVTVALPSIGSRFSNLCKVEFNYSGWKSDHGMQLDNQGLHVLSSCCPSLTDLILSFCLFIDDSGLGFPSILQEAGVSQVEHSTRNKFSRASLSSSWLQTSSIFSPPYQLQGS